jgi:hypothetical protein
MSSAIQGNVYAGERNCLAPVSTYSLCVFGVSWLFFTDCVSATEDLINDVEMRQEDEALQVSEGTHIGKKAEERQPFVEVSAVSSSLDFDSVIWTELKVRKDC